MDDRLSSEMPECRTLRIGLDFDGTFTESPEFWHRFIDLAEEHGHEVAIITGRPASWGTADVEEAIRGRVPIHYTNMLSKHAFMEAQGLSIDIWVDDQPSRGKA